MSDVSAGLEHLRLAFETGAKGINLWKSLRGSKPTPEQEDQIDRIFKDAETERQLALAEIGKAFDYRLCKCTIPPQVCPKIGFSEYGQEQSRCPKCGQEYPLPENLPPQRKGSWMGV